MFLRRFSRCDAGYHGDNDRYVAFRISNARLCNRAEDVELCYDSIIIWFETQGRQKNKLMAIDGTTEQPLPITSSPRCTINKVLFPKRHSTDGGRSFACDCSQQGANLRTEAFDQVKIIGKDSGDHTHKLTVTKSSTITSWICAMKDDKEIYGKRKKLPFWFEMRTKTLTL